MTGTFFKAVGHPDGVALECASCRYFLYLCVVAWSQILDSDQRMRKGLGAWSQSCILTKKK
jgi:alanine dehydrogenase